VDALPSEVRHAIADSLRLAEESNLTETAKHLRDIQAKINAVEGPNGMLDPVSFEEAANALRELRPVVAALPDEIARAGLLRVSDIALERAERIEERTDPAHQARQRREAMAEHRAAVRKRALDKVRSLHSKSD
jgi:hypothetical protein